MRLVILGNSTGAPGPNRASPGYLVETERAALLLDCGPGVVGKLVAHRPVTSLTAIVVSHMHLDHVYDLPVLLVKRRMERAGTVRYADRGPDLAPAPALRVYLPPGGKPFIEAFLGVFDADPAGDMEASTLDGIELREYDAVSPLVLDDCTVTFFGPLAHAPGDCYAMRVRDRAGATLAYSGDTAPTELLIDVAQDADCFLCEATFTGEDGRPDPAGRHLTAREAGTFATRAVARSLVLTHFLAHDEDWYAALERAAQDTYYGPLALAQPDDSFAITQTSQDETRHPTREPSSARGRTRH